MGVFLCVVYGLRVLWLMGFFVFVLGWGGLYFICVLRFVVHS